MAQQKKFFKIKCPVCEKPFHFPFPIVDPNAQGTGDVTIKCMYCCEKLIVTIPRKNIEKEITIKKAE